ncbi:unnamed protein product [Pieris macdunnoughi]|uniref:Uncharacterized protein n=1 Tax=Pieris macdunnoughi TaxID=345717 RepID=A0A821XQF1_9NEOP|nr:unnamed protein product [Pieris macdunnoughi]
MSLPLSGCAKHAAGQSRAGLSDVVVEIADIQYDQGVVVDEDRDLVGADHVLAGAGDGTTGDADLARGDLRDANVAIEDTV